MNHAEDAAERAVQLTLRFGASDCDVLASSATRISSEIERGSVKQTDSVSDHGVGIRAFVNGSVGFAYCNSFQHRSVDRAAGRAVAMARAGTPDPAFKGLPSVSEPSKVSGLFDPEVAKLQPDEVVRMSMELAEVAADDKRVYSVNASVSAGQGEAFLANSNGFRGFQRMSQFGATCEAVAKSGSEMFSGYELTTSRKMERHSLDGIGLTARQYALKGLSHVTIDTGDLPVVIDPLALGFILATAIGRGADAEAVQRNRSFLAGRMGRKIGVDTLTIRDDPTLKWCTGSYSFDGEGVPARRKVIIDAGKLRSYLYDSYTAAKDSVMSTGNSLRGHALWTYRQPPTISSSNLVIRQGDCAPDEMISETKNGIYLRTTFDYPNLATGEFSGLMMESYRIEKGELGPSIRQATMGIDIVDLLSRIDLIGRDARYAWGVMAPPVRISRARIGGTD